jgi:hypothetical protein
MSYSTYTNLSGLSLGETAFSLEKAKVTASYIDFNLTVYGNPWNTVDIAFEYRYDDYDQWRTDAVIIGSQSEYIEQNKLLGIPSSDQGVVTQFRWKYPSNNITEGMKIELRLRLLPRTQNYSCFDNKTVISEAYGESFYDYVGSIDKKCIRKDLYGRYICLDDTSISIYESLSDSSPLYSYSGLTEPKFAIQIRRGSYIVADYGANRIIELDDTLNSLLESYSVPDPIYLDFSEQNETLLYVLDNSSILYEVTWSETSSGVAIWNSLGVVSCGDLVSATYNRDNFDQIVTTDGSRIYIIDRLYDTSVVLDSYSFSNGVGDQKSSAFWNPYRVYFYDNETICVVEKDGEVINFEMLYSSSSSSS